ncbi:MAG: hypothetical protein GXP32_02925 [Kiritimatiellaeota bacterium]|nr:hypothetical protein [Kiritimatiellota bacterium]
MKKGIIKNIALNLMAPGFAQYSLGQYIRGTIYFASAIAGVLWVVVVFGNEVKTIWNNALNGGDMTMSWHPFITPLLLTLGAWMVSFLDLFIFNAATNKKPPPLPGDRRKSE